MFTRLTTMAIREYAKAAAAGQELQKSGLVGLLALGWSARRSWPCTEAPSLKHDALWLLQTRSAQNALQALRSPYLRLCPLR